MASDPSAGTVQLEYRSGVAVIRLLGEHDMSTIGDVRNAIEGSVAGGHGIVVSLAETEFIDSGVIHAIYTGDALLNATGRRLVLHVATASVVRRMLDISRVSTALPCTGELETAVKLASAGEGEPQWIGE
jgi:anti-anti-sigma factor